MEGGQRGELGGGAQTKTVLAGRAVRRDLEAAPELLLDPSAVHETPRLWQLCHRLDRQRTNTGPVENDLLGLIQMRPLDGNLHRGAPLRNTRRDAFNVLEHRTRLKR